MHDVPISSARTTAAQPSGQQTLVRAGAPANVVAAAVALNALEFYDFGTYALFAVFIGKAFFPSSIPVVSLLLSVAVFGVGFVTRPLGAVLIGAYADRAGRKAAMLLTAVLITVGTAGLALTPTYASIGLAAPVLIVLCRLVQGLALGGDVGPATAFLVEAAPSGRRGMYASWQVASQGLAAMSGGLLGLVVTGLTTPQQLQDWGWRVPFAAGLLLVPVVLVLRTRMSETYRRPAGPRAPGRPLLSHTRTLGLAIVLILGATVSTYIGTYMTTYAIATLKLPPLTAIAATVGVGFATFVFSLAGGWLSDRWGRKVTMLWPRVAIAILIVPAFTFLIARPSLPLLVAVSVTLGALTAISGTASIIAISELLPQGVRASGLAIPYAVGVAAFGGTAQFVVTWLIAVTGNPQAPAWYVLATSIVTLLGILACPETRHRAVAD